MAPMTPGPTITRERFVDIVGQHEFVFAKTMPANPHFYTVGKKWPDREEFIAVLAWILTNGVDERHSGQWFRVVNVNGWKYWVWRDHPPHKQTLLNRARSNYESPYDSIAEKYAKLFTDPASRQEDHDVVQALVADTPHAWQLRRPLFDRPLLDGERIRFPGDVLDVGCGHGMLLEHIAPDRYLGIDPSPRMLALLAERHSDYAGDTMPTKFEHLCLPDRRFDVVCALFGSPSYVLPSEWALLDRVLDRDGLAFLMFFAPGYVPVTHQKLGIKPQFYEMPRTLRERPGSRVRRMGNFEVWTNR